MEYRGRRRPFWETPLGVAPTSCVRRGTGWARNETKHTKSVVLCRVEGQARVCIVAAFEDALSDELEDAGITYEFVDAINFKIKVHIFRHLYKL